MDAPSLGAAEAAGAESRSSDASNPGSPRLSMYVVARGSGEPRTISSMSVRRTEARDGVDMAVIGEAGPYSGWCHCVVGGRLLFKGIPVLPSILAPPLQRAT